jgi:hypothetical protein
MLTPAASQISRTVVALNPFSAKTGPAAARIRDRVSSRTLPSHEERSATYTTPRICQTDVSNDYIKQAFDVQVGCRGVTPFDSEVPGDVPA